MKRRNGAPIRILHYIGSLESGGSQSMAMNVYRNVDRKKIQFDFIVDRKGENDLFYKDEIKKLGGKIYVFDEYFKGYNYFSFIKQWKDFFRVHSEYKIIHCHVRSVASIVLRIAKKNGLKTICHSHSVSNGGGLKALAKKILQGRIGKYCDYFFACSKNAAVWLYGEKIANSDDCMVISNAIEASKYKFNKKFRSEIREKYHIQDSVYLVGHVGRFEIPKNHKFIFDLAKDTKNDEGIVFMLCGEGSLKADFRKKIEEHGLGNKVIYVSSTDEIYKYYDAFDYFILPSLYEGLGMVLIEAQFSGLTCLVSPNIPEEAKISENYIVEDLEVGKWQRRISEKKKNQAREKVQLIDSAKNYDVTCTAKGLQDFYEDCIGREK